MWISFLLNERAQHRKPRVNSSVHWYVFLADGGQPLAPPSALRGPRDPAERGTGGAAPDAILQLDLPRVRREVDVDALQGVIKNVPRPGCTSEGCG